MLFITKILLNHSCLSKIYFLSTFNITMILQQKLIIHQTNFTCYCFGLRPYILMASYLILLFKLNSKLFDNLGTNQYFRIRQCMKFERVDILSILFLSKVNSKLILLPFGLNLTYYQRTIQTLFFRQQDFFLDVFLLSKAIFKVHSISTLCSNHRLSKKYQRLNKK